MGKLGKQIWKAVEATQGHGFVSDRIEDMPDQEAREYAQKCLAYMREAVKKLKMVLKQDRAKQKRLYDD